MEGLSFRGKCGESVREKRKPSVAVRDSGKWQREEWWERWTIMTKCGISVFVGLGDNAEA